MRRLLRLLPVAWLVALLLLPAGAWVAGARQTNLENRPPTPVPDLNRGTLRREATFQQLEQAIVDRLPLRRAAIEARGRLAVDLFRDSPNPDVAVGSDGWLYYREELRACTDAGRPAGDPADAADVLARTLVASGRTAGVFVAGSKIVTSEEHRPDLDRELLDCVRATEARVHARLAATPGGLDVQEQLEALERSGRPAFLRTDTHWSAAGRAVVVREILDRIRPGLAAEAGLRRGRTFDRPGDLGPFIGLPRSESDEPVIATRTPPRPLEAGQVLLIGDSQLDYALLHPLGDVPAIRDVVLPGQPDCTWPALAAGTCDAALAGSRTVIVEIVGRSLSDLVATCWRPVSIAAAGLRGEPGTWERTDGGPQRGRVLELEAGTAQVRVRTPGPDVRDVPRLLRLPLRRLPAAPAGTAPSAVTLEQLPQAGPPAPCASQPQAAPDGALFLPVPAGRRASDLVVRLTAPPGTVLGRPQEIVLDGRPAATGRRR